MVSHRRSLSGLSTTASRIFDFDRIMRAINYVKRASAKLDDVELETTERQDLFVGMTVVSVMTVEIPPMDPQEALIVAYLADELDNPLTDELGNILTD